MATVKYQKQITGYFDKQNTGMSVSRIWMRLISRKKQDHGETVDFGKDFANSRPPGHDIFDGLLKKYTDSKGQLDYNSWSKSTVELEVYLENLSSNPPNKDWDKAETISYWINAYNAFTIKLILDHYPVKSIREIGGRFQLPFINSVWGRKFFSIGNIPFSLNRIEHGILRSLNEPRIHFAINCASNSCPAIRNGAYTADKLDWQMEEQTEKFIADHVKKEADELELSPLFDWYMDDFGGKTALRNFLQKYKKEEIGPDSKFRFSRYDWNLNENKNSFDDI